MNPVLKAEIPSSSAETAGARLVSAGLAAEEADEVRKVLGSNLRRVDFHPIQDRADFEACLAEERPVLILAGGGPKGWSPLETLRLVSTLRPEAPCLGLVPAGKDREARALVEAGAEDAFSLDQLWRLPLAVGRILEREDQARAQRRMVGMEVLLDAVKQLSLARRMDDIVDTVRRAARQLSRADGATFVLRDGNQCHYVEEDAIGPLWRGLKFPMSNCISGWAMLNKRAAVIPDIYADPRIPVDAYRPTFVKSLVMMPIRAEDPVGAIGTYWARRRVVSDEEVALIQVLADSTALAIENVRFLGQLERRVEERTASLEGSNRELEAFSYSVSHDLRSPLAVILGYSELMLDSGRDDLAEKDRRMLGDIHASGRRMHVLIEDMLRLSKVTSREVVPEPVDLASMSREILARLAAADPARAVDIVVAEGLRAEGDAGLLRIALENLLSNAWKFSSIRPRARIEVGAAAPGSGPEGFRTFFVCDDGAGFAMESARRLFEPFQRLHTSREFPGTGIGLATVHRVLAKHGGKVWAEAVKDRGSTFYFSLPETPAAGLSALVSARVPA